MKEIPAKNTGGQLYYTLPTTTILMNRLVTLRTRWMKSSYHLLIHFLCYSVPNAELVSHGGHAAALVFAPNIVSSLEVEESRHLLDSVFGWRLLRYTVCHNLRLRISNSIAHRSNHKVSNFN